MSTRPTRPLEIEDVQGRLDRLREAANESARSFRTAYAFYLIAVLYILVIVSSTQQELLFRGGDVKMPIVNAGVPVVWFFTVVPWLLVLLHFNLLIQAIFLANKVSQYAAALDEQVRSRTKRSEELGLLYPAPLAHKIADTDQQGRMRRLLNVIVFVTLAVLPPTILIFTQVQFLPYQDELFAWLHRTAVVVDIGLLWWLWPRIAVPHMAWREWCRTRRLKTLAVATVAVFAGFFSIVIADFPGGTMGHLTPSLDSLRNSLGREYYLSERVLVHKEPSPEILAAHYRVMCASGNGCDESVIAVGSPFWCKHAKPLQLMERNVRDALLFWSTLCGVTLREAELHGAILGGSELHGADLWEAKLHGADLWEAKLHGADLQRAEFHGADLWEAELHGADLREAELHGTTLREAKLHGADLQGAKLHGAGLWRAELHGADLREAELHGADLWEAKLHGADLREAKLHGTTLLGVEFHGADLREAKLHGTTLLGAEFHLTDLRGLDLSSGLNKEELEEGKRIIEKISSQMLREVALNRIKRIEKGRTYIDPQSLKDSVLCEGDDLHTRLKGSKLLDEIFVINCRQRNEAQLSAYYKKLSAYLVNLVCSDESGRVVEGIERRTIPSREHNLLSWKKVLSVVEKKKLNMLDESDCKTGEAIANEAEASNQ